MVTVLLKLWRLMWRIRCNDLQTDPVVSSASSVQAIRACVPQLEPDCPRLNADLIGNWFSKQGAVLTTYSDGMHRFWTVNNRVALVHVNFPMLEETLSVIVYTGVGNERVRCSKVCKTDMEAIAALRLAVVMQRSSYLELLHAGFTDVD